MPKKRNESFFGLHFDFHSRGVLTVAEVLRPDVISKLLDETKPDYVQIDTKGHPGYSSYPTRVGNPAPKMGGDQIKMWRELTARRDIALYGHHSGLFDMKVARDHPEWAVVDENGVVSDSYLSVFGDYADKFLIPQLIELANVWGLDGAWVDGECWGTKLDYSPMALAEWAKISDSEPPKPGEPGFADYLEFIREGFRRYVTHYVEVVKVAAPEFQLTSNWIYSAHMPEKPTVPVDFLSGDYAPNNSVNSARINGRFIACQQLPWDLMAWGHNSMGSWTDIDRSTKEYIQHAQEAAYVMALGGGFQFYNIQYGEGGTVQEWAIPVWKRTAEFVREREPFCKGMKLVPQVGVLLPTEAHYDDSSIPFSSCGSVIDSAKGLIHLAQDCGYSSEILETHHLDRLSEYPLLLLGKATEISPETKAAIEAYVENGGKLIIASPDSARLLGFELTEPTDRLIHISDGETLAPMKVRCADFIECGSDEPLGKYYRDNYMSDGPYTATKACGNVIALSFELGRAYPANRTTCARRFFKSLASRMFTSPLVSIEGSNYAELTLTEHPGKPDKLYVHLLNYGGEHNVPGVRGFSEIPPLYSLTVRINTPSTPKRVTLQPEQIEYSGDLREIKLERLEVYSILEIEF